MADQTIPTATATENELTLEAPSPVPDVKPEKAAGLVPVSDDVKSKLDAKVESFVEDLIASDANSPEFGMNLYPFL